MAERALIVVAFDNNKEFSDFQDRLQKLKPMFAQDENVQVFGAVGNKAIRIIDILAEGLIDE